MPSHDDTTVLIHIFTTSERAKWVAQLRDRIERHEKDTPQFRLQLWRAAFDTPGYKDNFDAPEEKVISYELLGTEQIAVDRALSKSYISILPPDDKQKVVDDIKEIVKKGEGLVWSDKEKGEFEYPYKTYTVIAKKK